MEKKLALFDFDGTITRKDTMFALLKYITQNRLLYCMRLATISPILILYKVGIFSSTYAKEKLLQHFLSGMQISDFNEKCRAFADRELPQLIRENALKKLEYLKNKNYDVWIISASAENWVEPWCTKQGFNCLASRLTAEHGFLTGTLNGPNCNGEEKKRRILQAIDLDQYQEIIAFGDTAGDREMFSLAHSSYYRPFV